MPSHRFLDRSARVLEARVQDEQARRRPGLQRLAALTGGLMLAAAAFFVLKGAALAAGVTLPGAEGLSLWLAGPDPVASALGTTLAPLFDGRG